MGNQEFSKDRTLSRNASVWNNFDIALYAPNLVKISSNLDTTHQSIVHQYINMSDYDSDMLEEIRDRIYDLELYGVATGKEIEQSKYENKIAILALNTAGEMLILAAKEYDVSIQSMIMAAREYAAYVEREELYLDKDRAIMATEREEAKLLEYQAKALLETFEQKSVEIDVAKAKLEVAKTNVKVILAQIASEEAGVKAIQTEVELAMTEVESATLEADIAQILVEIVTRGLISIRLSVEREDIFLTEGWLESFLTDTLDLYNKRILSMEYKGKTEKDIGDTIPLLEEASKKLENLKITKVENDLWRWNIEKKMLEQYTNLEEIKRDTLSSIKVDYEKMKGISRFNILFEETLEARRVNAARRWVYLNYHDISDKNLFLNQIIHQGVASMPTAQFGKLDSIC
jgi:hypothetical protein